MAAGRRMCELMVVCGSMCGASGRRVCDSGELMMSDASGGRVCSSGEAMVCGSMCGASGRVCSSGEVMVVCGSMCGASGRVCSSGEVMMSDASGGSGGEVMVHVAGVEGFLWPVTADLEQFCCCSSVLGNQDRPQTWSVIIYVLVCCS